jgi:hypothetical protein
VLEADRLSLEIHQSEGPYQSPANEDHQIAPVQERQLSHHSTAPLFVLRNVTTDSTYPANTNLELVDIDHNIANSSSQEPFHDIIIKKLLSPQDAFSLLGLFQMHYARWVSFDKDTPTTTLLEKVRKFPLLLTACCLIAVR